MSIRELLDPQAVALQMEAADSTEVITMLGGMLLALGCVGDDFVAATLAREAEMPTGLPLGGDVNAAIPHVDIEYVKRPALALATLRQPVTFQHMVTPTEAVSVQLVIMLALDQPKSQIEMLQQVAGILQQPAVVEQLMAATTTDEVFAILDEQEAPA